MRAYESIGMDMSWLLDMDNILDLKKKEKQENEFDNMTLEDIANLINDKIDTIKGEYVDKTEDDTCSIGEGISEMIESLKLKNIILMGHSFGGKISLLYASMYPVKKIVVFGSPYKCKVAKDNLKTRTLKKLKKIPGLNKLEEFAKKHIGSTDYKNASPMMREVLVNHVNLDITEEVKKIKSPLLIIWGTNDAAVPIADAYELEKLVPGSGLVVYPNCTHYAYLENLGQTINVLRSFLGG